MGGTGSGRKARDKSKSTKADFKPVRKTEIKRRADTETKRIFGSGAC